MAYFFISNGLRGCYVPDSVFVVKCDTRRELKSIIEYEARDMREAYGFGGSKKEVAALAAWCWRRRKTGWTYDAVLPFGREPEDRPFGLFVAHATRRDYLEQQRD